MMNRATIPILYLPKTRPEGPPISQIALPSGNILEQPYPVDERVNTTKLQTFWPNGQNKMSTPADSANSIYVRVGDLFIRLIS